MRQHIKLLSPDNLEENSGVLKELRIEDKKASNPQDFADILSRIRDKDEFNDRMRVLVCDNLIKNWKVCDHACQMQRLGFVARTSKDLAHLAALRDASWRS